MLRVGNIRNVPILIHWSAFLLFLGGPILCQRIYLMDLLTSFLLLLILLLHEFGHLLMARAVQITPLRIEIYFMRGMFVFVLSPEKRKNILVLLGGVLLQLVVAVLAAVLAYFFYLSKIETPELVGQIFLGLFLFNLVVLVINILPFKNTDGGVILKILRNKPLSTVRA